MMNFPSLVKVSRVKDGYDVVCTVKHPVVINSEFSKWFISAMTFYVNDNVVAGMNLGPNMSANPIVGIHLKQLEPGDKITVKWMDSMMNYGSVQTVV